MRPMLASQSSLMKRPKITPCALPNINQDGISLRDYLAATALASILKFRLSEGPEKNAKEAYQIADAMIRERGLKGCLFAQIDFQ
jgi:hypothetical protein